MAASPCCDIAGVGGTRFAVVAVGGVEAGTVGFGASGDGQVNAVAKFWIAFIFCTRVFVAAVRRWWAAARAGG